MVHVTNTTTTCSRLDAFISQLEAACGAVAEDPLSVQNQKSARNVIDRAALALQASILIRHGNPEVRLPVLTPCHHCMLPFAWFGSLLMLPPCLLNIEGGRGLLVLTNPQPHRCG